VHASRALTEYRGELLPGVYEDWVLQAAACHLDGPLAVEDVCGLAQAGL
jgi:hypothetical protein